MKFFAAVQTITLSEENVTTAKSFADRVTLTTNYADTEQYHLEKIRNDHFISKLGEEAVKKILTAYGNVKGPDYNIYTKENKSWDADLYFNDTEIAVKTQKRSAALRYGLSWTFQYSHYRKDIILDNPDAWVIFTEYDDLHPHQCYVYPPFQIKELMFKEPRLERLKAHKKVVYASDLNLTSL